MSLLRRPKIQIARLRPGDVIVLETDKSLSQQECNAVCSALRAKFPENMVVLCSNGMSWKSIVRPDGFA